MDKHNIDWHYRCMTLFKFLAAHCDDTAIWKRMDPWGPTLQALPMLQDLAIAAPHLLPSQPCLQNSATHLFPDIGRDFVFEQQVVLDISCAPFISSPKPPSEPLERPYALRSRCGSATRFHGSSTTSLGLLIAANHSFPELRPGRRKSPLALL